MAAWARFRPGNGMVRGQRQQDMGGHSTASVDEPIGRYVSMHRRAMAGILAFHWRRTFSVSIRPNDDPARLAGHQHLEKSEEESRGRKRRDSSNNHGDAIRGVPGARSSPIFSGERHHSHRRDLIGWVGPPAGAA